MFKFIDKHPFLSGVIVGVVTFNVLSNKFRKLIKGKIIIASYILNPIELMEDEVDPDEIDIPSVNPTTSGLEN